MLSSEVNYTPIVIYLLVGAVAWFVFLWIVDRTLRKRDDEPNA